MQKTGFGVLIAAAAAYAYYRYSKMNSSDKKSLKQRGKKMIEDNFRLGHLFNKRVPQPVNA